MRRSGKKHFTIALLCEYPCETKVQLVNAENRAMTEHKEQGIALLNSIINNKYCDSSRTAMSKAKQRCGTLRFRSGLGTGCWVYSWQEGIGLANRKSISWSCTKHGGSDRTRQLAVDKQNEIYPLV